MARPARIKTRCCVEDIQFCYTADETYFIYQNDNCLLESRLPLEAWNHYSRTVEEHMNSEIAKGDFGQREMRVSIDGYELMNSGEKELFIIVNRDGSKIQFNDAYQAWKRYWKSVNQHMRWRITNMLIQKVINAMKEANG